MLLKLAESVYLSKTAAGTTGYLHSVDSCGTVDGPGVRFVVFTSGCPMRCLYCHNPDTRYLQDGKAMHVDELLDEIGTYSDFIKHAGGGLTVSGGEPLLQADFVAALFKGVKERYGMHTALDTSGHATLINARKVLPYTDLVLLDIKSWHPETYKKVTSRTIDKCLLFANLLKEQNKPAWIRFVLVPGLTDDESNMQGLSDFLTTLPNVERIEILPFHKMGEYKWEGMNMNYLLKDTPSPNTEQVEKARRIFEKSGHKVVV